MPIEAERLDDESLEVAREKVCEEEGKQVVVRPGRKRLVSGEKRVTVGAFDAGNVFALAKPVDIAARAAIRIGEKIFSKPLARASATACSNPGTIFCG